MSDIRIRGARTHNLKNIDLDLPRNKLIVLTGLSGSGKSSLAFDTLYAEGQRSYVQSLSSYARQFLELMEKPDVDLIDGLSPAIAIEQKSANSNPRSTVGTTTEIYDYLRLLFARIGTPFCPHHGVPLTALTVSEITDRILLKYEDRRVLLIAPAQKNSPRTAIEAVEDLQARGYNRFRIKDEIFTVDELPNLSDSDKVDVVVDRLRVRSDSRQRVAEGVEAALRLSAGRAIVLSIDDGEEDIFSDRFACPFCGYSVPRMEPKLFSFNSPTGSCSHCGGLGEAEEWNIDLIVSAPHHSLSAGAIENWDPVHRFNYQILEDLSKALKFSLSTSWEQLDPEVRRQILWGTDEEVPIRYGRGESDSITVSQKFEGIVPITQRRYESSESSAVRAELGRWKSLCVCPVCKGSGLSEPARFTFIGAGEQKKSISEITEMALQEAKAYFSQLSLEGAKEVIASKLIEEILLRLSFLEDVGLSYLTLSRRSNTLSGGEVQRIRLAGQIGSRLTGVMYVLDEPSIGLHQCDNDKLIRTLQRLRDQGNTVIVVEHDEDTIKAADYIVDLGPGAGSEGGYVCARGTPQEIEQDPNSLTGAYLSGRMKVISEGHRKEPDGRFLIVRGARGNNLRGVDVSVPVGLMTVVTGVSGSGKSTLINETIYRIAARALNGSSAEPLLYDSVSGLDFFDKVIVVDQSPIGKTPRSNPATYCGILSPIRDLFAQIPLARERGYGPGRFSFNVKGGRCEACEGEGLIRVEMNFLPDMYVPCDVCNGSRYNRETLEVEYKGHNIAQVLNLTVDEASKLFENVPAIVKKLRVLSEVGLGYIKLGQSAVTLSGGEAQRLKLATELSKRGTGKTLYILDEPTTGLHFHDVAMLLRVLNKLKEAGNTLLIIEHNLDIIRAADWIVDIGPGGGVDGGQVVGEGVPEVLREIPASKTGKYLRNLEKR